MLHLWQIKMINDKARFVDLLDSAMKSRGLSGKKLYEKRLKWETEEILAKDKQSYFLDLFDRKIKYPSNQNNLLVCWLLGIVQDFDINDEPANHFTGDLPDVDIDYIPMVRDYLKNEWAPKTFGEEYVCNIGNYTTFGIKSALIDMARVHGESREEVMAVTKNLDAKDDEGNPITWDAAIRLDPDFKSYVEKYPSVAEATKKLINRNRGMGVHAGGLIISRNPIHDLVPLVKRKDNPQASAWVEGLHGQDLQPVGLVKFDLLVISNLLQIARCCEMVKSRRGITSICGRPGEPDWSDVDSWRNDADSLAMANSADLKCIFQFDSEGIRGLVRAGGVDRFEDLVVYSAIFRPGCLKVLMDKRYVERKKGREKFELHPLIKPILEKTYGVMVYQEQIMKILHVVGNIPLKDCEAVRKAISKKKIESIAKYKDMFIENGMKNLSYTKEQMEEFFAQILSFSEYGFNLSHAVAYNYISMYLLYLKSHYPPEFYASMLSCETVSDKIKDFKMEAKIHGVNMHRLDINKSKVNFELVGDMIYYGFSNVKGIGEGPAQKIVSNQPYSSFEDFLYRCSTDSSILKPILGLRCFRDRDPITLWKFAEHFKDCLKKNEDRRKRFEAILQKYEEDLKILLPECGFKLSDLKGESPFDGREYQEKYDINEEIEVLKEYECDPSEGVGRIEMETMIVDGTDVTIEREVMRHYKKIVTKRPWNRWNELKKLWVKRLRSIQKFSETEMRSLPKLIGFDADKYDVPKELEKDFRNPILCEEKYYGFAWIHELERSPDYKGNLTFDAIRSNHDGSSGPVELKIKKVEEKTSKKGSSYWQIAAEDVTGQENKINIWADDWNRWSKEFVKGNLLRVRLQPPNGGFPTFLLESNQGSGRFRFQKKYHDKEDDPRVIIMRFGKAEEEKHMTDEEVLNLL
jgi:DNA polymerase III alpha subunit